MELNELPKKESFAELLESSMSGQLSFEGKVVKGRIVAIQKDIAIIDVGLKSEGRVPLKEINARGLGEEVKVGDTIDVFVERIEDRNGDAALSVEKHAAKLLGWILKEHLKLVHS